MAQSGRWGATTWETFPHLWWLPRLRAEYLYSLKSLKLKGWGILVSQVLKCFFFFLLTRWRWAFWISAAPLKRCIRECGHAGNLNISHLSSLSFAPLVGKWVWNGDRQENVKSSVLPRVAYVHKCLRRRCVPGWDWKTVRLTLRMILLALSVIWA